MVEYTYKSLNIQADTEENNKDNYAITLCITYGSFTLNDILIRFLLMFTNFTYDFELVTYIGIRDEFMPLVLENSSSALKCTF